MFQKVLVTVVFLMAAVSPGLAATSTTAQSGSPPSEQGAAGMPSPKIAEKMHDSLTQAGFTDIHTMPQSFLIRAKDKDGNPVMMVVNPDSITSVTAMSSSHPAASNNNGNSASDAASSPPKNEPKPTKN
jgi:hypothetical protein